VTARDEVLVERTEAAFKDIKGFLSEMLADVPLPDAQSGSLAHVTGTFPVGEGGAGRAAVEVAVYRPERWPALDNWFRDRDPHAPEPRVPETPSRVDIAAGVARDLLALSDAASIHDDGAMIASHARLSEALRGLLDALDSERGDV
jgi:hypothetical protein